MPHNAPDLRTLNILIKNVKPMKKAIVIGASSGIGRELAKILSQNGYTIGVMARRKHLLKELRKEIRGKIFVREINVNEETVMGIFSDFINEIGEIDLIVISAGTGEINNDLNWQIENETTRTKVIGFTALVNVAIHHFMAKVYIGIFASAFSPNTSLMSFQSDGNPWADRNFRPSASRAGGIPEPRGDRR